MMRLSIHGSASLCVLVACLCAPALAQGAGDAPEEGAKRQPGQQPREVEEQPAREPGPLLRVLDLDKDGALSTDEIAKAAVALLALDKNKDGKLTRDEFGSGGEDGPLAALDKDGDGKISKAEADDRLKERFDEVDADRNGFLDAAELGRRQPAGPEGHDNNGPGARGKPARGMGLRGGAISPIQVALDANRDQTIDAEEVKRAPEALAALDKDKDGRVAGAELAPVRRSSDFFARFDKDGDGKISKDEAPEHMKERFDALDMNGDGYLEEADLDAFRQRYGGKPRGRGKIEGGDGDDRGEGK